MPTARPARSRAGGAPAASPSRAGGWRWPIDLALLAAIECLWSRPLAWQLTAGIPGQPGDNLSFLWNFWWTRKALASPGLHVFETGYLFYPFHVDLALNTHTALNAWLGATVLAPFSIVTALNVTILASLILAAFGAYWLAFEVTGHRAGALAAGLLFGECPYLAAHLAGHFNLTSAWVLPWFALAFVRAIRGPSWIAAAAAGLCLVAAAYTDYYYVVFLAVLAGVYVLARWQVVEARAARRVRTPRVVRLARVLATLLAVVLVMMAVVLATGGGVLRVGSVAVSIRQTFNLQELGWLLMVAWVLTHWQIGVRVRRPAGTVFGRDWPRCVLMAAVFLAGVLPLGAHAIAMWRHGDYATQAYSWKSAPQGIDLLALIAGNPFHPVFGPMVSSLYRGLDLNRVEGVAWIGVVPALLAWVGWRRWTDRDAIRPWGSVFVVFLVWALGPFLRVAGANTGLVLPETLVRFVPIVANARMPGRAMVMVYLALAVFVAMGLASLRGRWHRPLGQAAVATLIVFSYFQAPLAMYQPEPLAIYTRLAALPQTGALLELPFGLADGFGERGRFDRRDLYYQTIHQRPIAGGFIARLSPRVLAEYARLPVIGPLWKLSDDETVPPADLPAGPAALDALAREGFAFVLLNRAEAPPALARYVDSLPLTLVMRDGERELLAIPVGHRP